MEVIHGYVRSRKYRAHCGKHAFPLHIWASSRKNVRPERVFGSVFSKRLGRGLLTLVPLLGPDTLSVGASGAIFGVIGAVTVYARRSIGQSIISALMFVFLLFALNLGQNVNYLAHLGGLGAGLLLGYLLATTRKTHQAVTYEYKYPSSYP